MSPSVTAGIASVAGSAAATMGATRCATGLPGACQVYSGSSRVNRMTVFSSYASSSASTSTAVPRPYSARVALSGYSSQTSVTLFGRPFAG